MGTFTVVVSSHGAKITANTTDEKFLLHQFCDELTAYEERWSPERRKRIRTAKTLYAFRHYGGQSYSIHRNHLPHFIRFIERQPRKHRIEMDTLPLYRPVKATIKIRQDRPPYDEQLPIIEHLVKAEPIITMLLQTGKGKTYTSLVAASQMGYRTVVMCLPREIPTWQREADNTLVAGRANMRIIDGGGKLVKLIKDIVAGKEIEPIIMMQSPTMAVYLKEYSLTGKAKIGIPPDKLMEFLGVGVLFTDETHERLSFNFHWASIIHVPKCIYLTATLSSNNRFTNKLYEVLCPMSSRLLGIRWDKYVNAYAIGYKLEDPELAEYVGPRGSYSHDVYEQWILADADRTYNYLGLVNDVLVEGHINRFKPGMIATIFFYKVDFCRLAANYFKSLYPEMRIASFNHGDPESVLLENDIIISTIQSAGTGKDIPGWMTTICTVAIDAKEKNIQVLGRTRKPKPNLPWSNDECLFYYLVCTDIRTHIIYHENKIKTFTGRVKSLKVMSLQRKV